ADVEVDDAVIVDVDLPVVVEVAVEPARDPERRAGVDVAVVVDVDLAVEVRVAAVGVHDQGLRAGNSLPGPDGGGGGGGEAFDFGCLGDADGGDAARRGLRLRGHDALPVPRAAVASGLNETGDATVGIAGGGADGQWGDELVVGDVQLSAVAEGHVVDH